MLTKRKFHGLKPLKYIEIQSQMTKSKDTVCGLYRYFLSLLYGNTAKAIHMFMDGSHMSMYTGFKNTNQRGYRQKTFK